MPSGATVRKTQAQAPFSRVRFRLWYYALMLLASALLVGMLHLGRLLE